MSSIAGGTRSGFLQKKSTGLVQRWQRRYFAIAGQQLHYFTDEAEAARVFGGNDDAEARAKAPSACFDLGALAAVSVDAAEMRLEGRGGAVIELKSDSAQQTKLWQQTFHGFLPQSASQQANVRGLAASFSRKGSGGQQILRGRERGSSVGTSSSGGGAAAAAVESAARSAMTGSSGSSSSNSNSSRRRRKRPQPRCAIA